MADVAPRVRGPRNQPETYLQNEQGKAFAFLTARRLTRDMQRLIWADVRNNYYRRLGDTRLTGLHAPGPAFYARYLQAAVRRLLTFVRNHRNINFSMLAASNATRGSLVWKHRFDNLHERRIRYRVATSPKWHWGVVGQYEQTGDESYFGQ